MNMKHKNITAFFLLEKIIGHDKDIFIQIYNDFISKENLK